MCVHTLSSTCLFSVFTFYFLLFVFICNWTAPIDWDYRNEFRAVQDLARLTDSYIYETEMKQWRAGYMLIKLQVSRDEKPSKLRKVQGSRDEKPSKTVEEEEHLINPSNLNERTKKNQLGSLIK